MGMESCRGERLAVGATGVCAARWNYYEMKGCRTFLQLDFSTNKCDDVASLCNPSF